uniref:C-type lectin domain-containing protein n=1 Tax=Panagrellus redivivus TaxID=6233 RepID=A0A7E4VPD4_PANRE
MRILSEMWLINVVFLLVILEFSSSTDHFPFLTLPEARCPESPDNLDFWHLTDFEADLRCLSPVYVKTKIQPIDLRDKCRRKHADAVSADLNPSEVAYFNKVLESGSEYYMCRVEPYPRVVESYLRNHYPNSLESKSDAKLLSKHLNDYKCIGEGWKLAQPCSNTSIPSCYKVIKNIGNSVANEVPAEFNYCGMVEPNSFMASVHCEDECHFLTKNFPSKVKLGLYLPRYANWNKFSSWQWTDRSPTDYIPWQLGAPAFHHGTERLSQLQRNRELDSVPNGSGSQLLLCKKKAIQKRPTLNIQKAEKKQCREEPPSHWNHRCPSGSDSWRIVESEDGVHCFDFVTAPFPLTPYNFNHKLCSKLHINAKLASFQNDIQLGFVVDFLNHPNAANDIIVGMKCKTAEDCEWLDKTKSKTTFWAPGQPQNSTINHIVKIQNFQFLPPCDRAECKKKVITRPLFVTKPMSTVNRSMKIACRINARPVNSCPPVQKSTGIDTVENTKCKPGWAKMNFCDVTYCYKVVDVPKHKQNYKAVYEDNVCKATSPKAHLASIHCLEEHYYIQGLPSETAIGLHILNKLRKASDKSFDVKDFQWTDGSAFDFVGWNRYSRLYTPESIQEPIFPKRRFAGLKGSIEHFAFNKYDDQRSGWTNINTGLKRVLCKEKAEYTSNLG